MSLTPGPWEINADDLGYWGVYNKNGECIAEATEPGEYQEDIRLMAAALEIAKELAWLVRELARYEDDPEREEMPDWRDAEALLRRIDGEEEQ